MSTQQPEANSAAQQGTSSHAQEGHYTNVSVTPIQHQGGTLRGGTGTMSAIGVFSCGTFDKNDLPSDGFYNITGSNGLNLPGWKCVHGGPTSDFKAR